MILRCEQCGMTGGVEFESSRTQYHHKLCEHEDCLACPELREVCRPCAAEHHANWDGMWADYYSSRFS